MSDENKNPTLEERLKKEEKQIVNYHPISPNERYDRETFVKAQKALKNFEEYMQVLSKDPFDVNAREDLSYLLFKDIAKHVGMKPEEIRKIGNSAFSNGIENMAKYVENNYNNFMDKLDSGGLTNLVMGLPLYKTSNKEYGHERIAEDKEHNELVYLINEIKLMNSDDKEVQGKVVGNILSNIIKSKEVPDWAKSLIQYFAKTDAHFVNEMVVKYKTERAKAFSEHITKDGKPDKDKLKSLIDKSLKIAYAEFNELNEKEHEEERKDIWEKVIRPYYIEMARALYKSEKKELEKDIEEKRKENEREEYRNELGMAA
jgi:hypothetical protein